MSDRTRRARYRVIGMDCANDAAEIEKAVGRIPAGAGVRVSIASGILSIPEPDLESSRQIEGVVGDLGYRLELIEQDEPQPHLRPSYRRALWTVVALNLGYGVVEAIGGFLAGSQAVKADALDFVGDGLITLLGLIALGWSSAWRARAALAQGIFLGLLGTGVLANTAYRVIVRQDPSYEAMGVLAGVALLVNLAAAAALLPHRGGDANVRAVWLFSRNDAIGNLLVLGAAAMVAATGTPWPDLAVGGAVALLFLHSSVLIVRSARADLQSGH